MNSLSDPSFERILRAVDTLAAKPRTGIEPQALAAIKAFVATGDTAILNDPAVGKIKDQYYWWGWDDIFKQLAAPTQMGTADRRLLSFAHAAEMFQGVIHWLLRTAGNEAAAPEGFGLAMQEAERCSYNPHDQALLFSGVAHQLDRDDAPRSAGRWFLALDEQRRLDTLRWTQETADSYRSEVVVFCAKFAPDLLRRFLDESAELAADRITPHTWIRVLAAHPNRFEQDAVRALEACQDPNVSHRFSLARALYEVAPERHRARTIAKAREVLHERATRCSVKVPADWLIETLGSEAVPEFVRLIEQFPVTISPLKERYQRELLLAACVLGRAAAQPVVDAYLASTPMELFLPAIEQLLAWNEPATLTQAQEALAVCLRAPKNPERVLYIQAVDERVIAALEAPLWKLLEDKSKPTREAAAKKLSTLGLAAVLPKALALLVSPRTDSRLATVYLLVLLADGDGAEQIRAALSARLEVEIQEVVCDAIHKVLSPTTGAAGSEAQSAAPASRAEIDALVARTAGKLTGPPVSWLDENRLPALYLRGETEPLPLAAVRFLLHRQARCKEMGADPQAQPLFAAIERALGGDFAFHVLQAYLATGQDAKDRWALAVAGLLGDGRVLRLLTRQIPEWVDRARGKLAEYGTEAIALLGTDEALLALDALAIRYRTKNKNVGAAASTAFAKAAEARGLTTDELGDRVVPWLGFPVDGGPRAVSVDDRRIEVRAGLDFKLHLLDADSRKKVTAWPSATAPETKAEMKELGAALRDAGKAQTLRIENQFGRQRRWPVARWRELFPVHPLLLPFAVRLVWGEYAAEAGGTAPRTTFRALPDGALTDVNDDVPEFGTGTFVGAVHPLEVDAETLTAWQAHLSDYEVEPPFPQMNRTVVRVTPEQVEQKALDTGAAAVVGALTFKSRVERRGWTRGSVIDGGGIAYYYKRFPTVDVFLETEGMFVSAGMDDQVTLGKALFVRGDSVKTGSYTYDEPHDEKDPRLIALGEVPPVTFSEAAGDIKLIAGRA